MQLYRGYIIEIAKKVGFASNNGESENQMEHDMENGNFWVFIGMIPSKSSWHTNDKQLRLTCGIARVGTH